ICSINSRQIKEALKASQVSMDRIRNIMANGNYEKLLNLFKQAKHKRDSYNKSQKSKIKT
ncbi:MAG: hypothetical protein U9R31_02055, partial [Candidatus Omnitrophota bacterium]|nr:hypothetical protein [Candidatus Omnitrophota bacterium]